VGVTEVTASALRQRAVEAVSHLADVEPPWAEILESGRQLVGADSATFMTFDGTGALTMHQDHLDGSAERDYVEHFHVLDVGLQTAMNCPSGTWINTHDLIPAKEMERSPYYTDFMCKHRMRQIVCHIVRINPVHRACFSFQREKVNPRAREQVEGTEISSFAHAMESALASRRDSAIRQLALAEDTLQFFEEAACLLSGDGKLIHASARALAIFESTPNVRLRGGRVWHQNAQVTRAICMALKRASESSQVLHLSIPAGVEGTLTWDMKRADGWMRLGNEALVMVRIRRTNDHNPFALDIVQALYNLSSAEVKVLGHLAAGRSASEISLALGISINTARKHIAVLLDKTGAKRQTDLLRIALQL
jgi:DNA-binding CsgD family transcriptional regulator